MHYNVQIDYISCLSLGLILDLINVQLSADAHCEVNETFVFFSLKQWFLIGFFFFEIIHIIVPFHNKLPSLSEILPNDHVSIL